MLCGSCRKFDLNELLGIVLIIVTVRKKTQTNTHSPSVRDREYSPSRLTSETADDYIAWKLPEESVDEDLLISI
jgi:hypothetical protein